MTAGTNSQRGQRIDALVQRVMQITKADKLPDRDRFEIALRIAAGTALDATKCDPKAACVILAQFALSLNKKMLKTQRQDRRK